MPLTGHVCQPEEAECSTWLVHGLGSQHSFFTALLLMSVILILGTFEITYVRVISGNLNWTAAAQLLAMILKSIDRFNGWMKENSGLVYVWTAPRVCRENKDPAGFTTDRRRFVGEWLKDQEQSKIRWCERDNAGNHCLKTHSCSNAELLAVILFTLSCSFILHSFTSK